MEGGKKLVLSKFLLCHIYFKLSAWAQCIWLSNLFFCQTFLVDSFSSRRSCIKLYVEQAVCLTWITYLIIIRVKYHFVAGLHEQTMVNREPSAAGHSDWNDYDMGIQVFYCESGSNLPQKACIIFFLKDLYNCQVFLRDFAMTK